MAERIFMGAGEHSMARCYRLHLDLDRALNILGGIQQPCHCSSPCECTRQLCDGEHEVGRIAADIYESLTGRTPSPSCPK